MDSEADDTTSSAIPWYQKAAAAVGLVAAGAYGLSKAASVLKEKGVKAPAFGSQKRTPFTDLVDAIAKQPVIAGGVGAVALGAVYAIKKACEGKSPVSSDQKLNERSADTNRGVNAEKDNHIEKITQQEELSRQQAEEERARVEEEQNTEKNETARKAQTRGGRAS